MWRVGVEAGALFSLWPAPAKRENKSQELCLWAKFPRQSDIELKGIIQATSLLLERETKQNKKQNKQQKTRPKTNIKPQTKQKPHKPTRG